MAKIVLLHGLHMHAWAMRPLAHFFRQHGFDTETFGYYSLMQTLPQHAAALERRLGRQTQPPVVHFVGHSLGGLVLRHFAARYPQRISGRIVTLGTPHQGSLAAERVCRFGLRRPVLGGAYGAALDGCAPPLPASVCLGSIAGNKPQGLGRLLGLDGEHDGTVRVAETRCAGMSDHLILPLSHSGLLLSREAAWQAAFFLANGRFDNEGGMGG